MWSLELTTAEIRRLLEDSEVLSLLIPAKRLPPATYELRMARGEELLLAAPFTTTKTR